MLSCKGQGARGQCMGLAPQDLSVEEASAQRGLHQTQAAHVREG